MCRSAFIRKSFNCTLWCYYRDPELTKVQRTMIEECSTLNRTYISCLLLQKHGDYCRRGCRKNVRASGVGKYKRVDTSR